jgi:hypothetical protein
MKAQHGWLAAALANLAMPADAQIEYLEALGVAPSADELALEFEDAVFGLQVAAEAREFVAAVDAQLDRMSDQGEANLWEFNALRKSAEWREVRRLATLALDALRRA